MDRRASIDSEILKCKRMLTAINSGSEGYIGAEVVIADKRYVKAIESYDNYGMTAFQSNSRTTDIKNFNGMTNCNGQTILRSTGPEYDYNGKKYREIVFRSENKSKSEISARCVFEARIQTSDDGATDIFWYPLAYLFSTNDPLNMDNFNFFTEWGTVEHAKCVEQLAFCEDKLKIGLYCIKNASDAVFKSGIMEMASSFQPTKVPPPLTVLLKNKSSAADTTDTVTPVLETMTGESMKTIFIAELTPKLTQEKNLQQFKFYKQAGRSVPDVGGFMNIWNKYSLLCVLSARMIQLKSNVKIQQLVAGAIFRCIAEVRDDDKIWAYGLQRGEKLDIFDKESSRIRLHDKVIMRTLSYQDAFIDNLKIHTEKGDTDKAFNLLTSVAVGKLGLSERILQSLWSRQIAFPEALKAKISGVLKPYGIETSFEIPDLKELKTAGVSPIELINSIGVAA
jgi:hypothetical protein